jgi:hypothetical protein
MLLYDERADLIRALAAILGTQSYTAYLQSVFVGTPHADEILGRLRTNELPTYYAGRVVELCLASRWRYTPAVMEYILVDLTQRGKNSSWGVTDFNDVLTQVRNRIDRNPDPVNDCWVVADLPFFGRSDLRQHLRKLLDSDDRAILSINGEQRKCGKSYSAELIDYLSAKQLCNYRLARVLPLEEGYRESMYPLDLASAIATAASLKFDPPPESDHRDVDKMASWILRLFSESKDNWWVILDGFGHPEVPLETRKVIQKMAQMVSIGEHRKFLRLVMIDHPEKLANVPLPKIAQEKPKGPLEITEADVANCLRQRYQRLNRLATPEELERDAKKFLQSAPAAPEDRLEYLRDAIYVWGQQQTGAGGV